MVLLMAALAGLAVAAWFAAGFRVPSLAKEAAEPAERDPAMPSAQSEETRRMVARLEQLAAGTDGRRNEFANDRRVAWLRSLDVPAEPRRRANYERELGAELLRAGSTELAVDTLQGLWGRLQEAPDWRDSAFGRDVHSLLAIAHLRAGEQANCIRQRGGQSCILPIRGSGVHLDQRGSRAAMRELQALLDRNPEDLESRWLLNVAAMTVGEYPDGVPERWRIPPSAFASAHDVGEFRDIASSVGLGVVGLAGAAIVDDFDGDGRLDVFVTSMGLRDQVRYFRNRGDGRFIEQTEEAGLRGIVGGLNAVHADYDNDGHADIFIPRGGWLGANGLLPPSLLRNRGGGRFEDVTESAGLLDAYPSQSAAWGDFDNDGWLDLFVATESSGATGDIPTRLYRNNRDGSFTDVARQAGVAAVGFFKGAVWGDYDNDGRLDLYLTGIQRPAGNRLFRNDGPDAAGNWSFTDVADEAGVRGPWSSFTTWFFDYDNDGWLDLFVSGYAGSVAAVAADYLGIGQRREGEIPRLYRNQGDGTFRDVAAEVGLDTVLMTMGGNFGDLDNDGWLDVYAGTGNPDFRTLVPNRMFRNAGGLRFQDVTTAGGFGHLQKGHGIAFADVDQDGDQDVFIKIGGAYTGDVFQSALFQNPGHGNRWLKLALVGHSSNRSAIGARVRVTLASPSGPRVITTVVGSGSSFGGSPLRRELGLGDATRVERIEIDWPATGRRQIFRDLAVDQSLEIREDASEPRRLDLPTD